MSDALTGTPSYIDRLETRTTPCPDHAAHGPPDGVLLELEVAQHQLGTLSNFFPALQFHALSAAD